MLVLGLLCAWRPSLGASSDATVWGGVLVATADDSILPPSAANAGELTRIFTGGANPAARTGGAAALMSFDGVVLLSVISHADRRPESYRIPTMNGDPISIHRDELRLGGTVVLFSPLARTVLATSPLIGIRQMRLEEPLQSSRLLAEAGIAARHFSDVARHRASAMGGRSRRAPIARTPSGSPLLHAGSRDGVEIGTLVFLDSPAGAPPCAALQVSESTTELDCSIAPSDASTGRFLRSVGSGSRRYQIRSVSVTSEKARVLLGDGISSDSAMLAYVASDVLSSHGFVVLPPRTGGGERVVESAVTEFAAAHGLSDREVERFTIRFPPPEVEIDVVVDGYNTKIVGESPVKRIRAHKAWVRAATASGEVAEGVAVELANEIVDWQVSQAQVADARTAIIKATRCAIGALLRKGSHEECES